MPDLKAQTITLHEGDKTALQYLGAAVVLQWSSLPDDVRKAILRQADAVGGLPLVSDLHEQIQALIGRVPLTSALKTFLNGSRRVPVSIRRNAFACP